MPKTEKNPQKIRLLHLIQNLGVGGAEILLLQYIKALKTDDYEHFVYSIGSEGPIKEMIESMGVKLTIGPGRNSIRHPIRFAIDLLIIIKALLRFIKKNRIQIIQSHLNEANQLGVLASKLTNISIFPTIHNTNVFDYDKKKFNLKSKLHQVVDTLIYRAADRVITISEEVKTLSQKALRLDRSKIVVVRNGIIYEEGLLNDIDINKMISAEKEDFIIIGVGSLTYQKAFEVLIKASAEILQGEFSAFKVIIVGKGKEREHLERLIHKFQLENHVILMGYKENVLEYLNASDIFVMPSRYEGLSIAMIEAMACGLPIVASDAPGLRTYIQDQQNGLLFATEDHKGLAKQILRLIHDEDLRVSLSQNAYNTYYQSFDMNQNIIPLKKMIRCFAAKA